MMLCSRFRFTGLAYLAGAYLVCLSAASKASETPAPGVHALPESGSRFAVPVARDTIPAGAWYCDMGKVHFAQPNRGTGACPVCGMELVQKESAAAAAAAQQRVQTIHSQQRSQKMRWLPPVFNAADAPGRCAPADLGPFAELAWDPAKGPGTPVAAFVTQILSRRPGLRRTNFKLQHDLLHLDYYSNRAAVQAEFERQIGTAPGTHVLEWLDNYAWFLAYTGEFEKLRSFVPPLLERYGQYRAQALGSIAFALAQAHYRLGDFAKAVEVAKFALELVADTPSEVRWQLMLAEVALYGPDFFAKHSHDLYSVENIPQWYPKAEWELPFEDVSRSVGKQIQRIGASGAVNFVDFDGDGWDDLFLERKYFPPMLYRNQGGKEFVPVADAVPNDCSNLLSPVADFDNDGHLDMFRACCNFDGSGPLRLLAGRGDATFEDRTSSSIFAEERIWGMPPTWLDWDLDGDVDLFVGSFLGSSQAYRNEGNGTFVNVTKEIGLQATDAQSPLELGAVGTTAGYFFGSPYPDLYVQGFGRRRLYRNNGDGTFSDRTLEAGLAGGPATKYFLASSLDFDNDGDADILAASYATIPDVDDQFPRCVCGNLLRPAGFAPSESVGAATILENLGNGTFRDRREQTRFLPFGVMGVAHGDWNNDGFEDIVLGVGGPNLQQLESVLFYENQRGSGSFTNMTPFTMLSLWGKGHGLAFADYDHDGQLDLFINSGGMMPGDLGESLLLHNTGSQHHWLSVRLAADPTAGTNAAAIGARISIKVGDTRQSRTLFAGSFGMNSLQAHFGLGNASKVDEVVVEWPNKARSVTVLKDVTADQAILVEQASGSLKRRWPSPAANKPGS